MSASISFTDSEGTDSLENIPQIPVNTFSGWEPDALPMGHSAVGLGTGITDMFVFRTDYLVSLEVVPMPGSVLETALRLKAHLMNGGSVTLSCDNFMSSTYETCTLAPGTEPVIDFTDRQLLEYTFSCTLLAGESTGCVEEDTSNAIPYDYAFFYKDRIYGHDFGETYEDDTAWRAALTADSDLPDGSFYINEDMEPEVVFDADRPFNCRASLKVPSRLSDSGLVTNSLLLTALSAEKYGRVWGRCFVWFDESVPLTQQTRVEDIIDITADSDARVLTNYDAAYDSGGGGVHSEEWDVNGLSATSNSYVAAPYSGLTGRWVPIVVLCEDDGVGVKKSRWWVDGALIETVTGTVSELQPGLSSFYIWPAFFADGGTAGEFAVWYGLFEFVDGGTTSSPRNPYSGLEGITETTSTYVPRGGTSFAARTTLTGSSGSTSFDTTGSEVGGRYAGNMKGSTWFQWTAPSSGTATFDTLSTVDTSLDSVIFVRTGTVFGSLGFVGSNDDFTGGLSSVSFSAVSGTTYLIQAGVYEGAADGTLTLSWSLV